MKRKLNLPLILALVVIFSVLGISVHFLHAFQVRRSAGALLREAELAIQDGKSREAIGFLTRYVQLAPLDIGAVVKLGLEQVKVGQYRQAYFNLDRALRRDSSRDEARRELAKTALKLARFREAMEHSEETLRREPGDGEMLRVKAQSLVGLQDFVTACAAYQQAIEAAPTELKSYLELAVILREKEAELTRSSTIQKFLKGATPPLRADALVSEMVQENAGNPEAYFLRAGYRLKYSQGGSAVAAPVVDAADSAAVERRKLLESVVEDARKAIELDIKGEFSQALLVASSAAQQLGDIESARKFANDFRLRHPENAGGHLQLATIEVSARQLATAVDVLKNGVESVRINRESPDKTVASTQARDELRWNLVNLACDQRDLKLAREHVSLLRKSELPQARIDFLDARLLVEEQQWHAALKRLDSIRPYLAEWPQLAKQADFFLGVCYRGIGNLEQQLNSFRKVVAADPFSVPARMGAADALLALGRTQEALEEYRNVGALPQSGVQANLVTLAQQVVLATLRQPRQERNWALPKAIIDAAEKTAQMSADLVVLRAEILVAEGENDAAVKLLEVARANSPNAISVWTTSVALAQQLGLAEQANQLIDEAAARFGDRPELRLCRVRLLSAPGTAPDPERLRALAKPPETYSDAERVQLATGIAVAAIQQNDFELAKESCRLVAGIEKTNLQIRLLRFDLAVRSVQEEEIEQILDEIRQIEGNGGLSAYCEAVASFVHAKRHPETSTEFYERALAALDRARESRGNWSRVPLLVGEIEFQRGNSSAATSAYLRAVELGERSPQAISRAVQLLTKEKRYTDADRVLRQVQQQQAPFSQALGKLATEVSIGLEDFDRALDLARKATSGSEKLEDVLWMGRVFEILKRTEEAEKSLRHAVEIAPHEAAPRVELIQFLVRNRRMEDAERELAAVEKEIDAEKEPLGVAHCYESLGKLDEAEKRYDDAVARTPDDPVVVRGVADFYVRHNRMDKAQIQLERMVTKQIPVDVEDLRKARRNLAMLAATRGGEPNLTKAQSLLDTNLQEVTDSYEDRRALGVLNSMRPSAASRQKAIQQFEALVARGSQNLPEDRFALAMLYRAAGNTEGERTQLRILAGSHGDNPKYAAALANVLLRSREFAEAEAWIARLEKSAPGSLATLELRAAAQFELGRYDDARKTIHSALEKVLKPEDLESRREWALRLFEDGAVRLRKMNKTAEADAFAQALDPIYTAVIDDKPERQLMRVVYLTRQEQRDAALDHFQTHWKEAAPGILLQSSVALQTSCLNSPVHQQRLFESLDQIVQSDSESPVRSVLADLCMAMAKHDDAIRHYREVLKRDSKNVVALNNLAVLLAVTQNQHDEAFRLINELLQQTGPIAVFLDSRAMIAIAANQPERALQDLDQAIRETPSADNKFHRAQACLQLGRELEARTAFDEALQLGLSEEKLQPFEREPFRRLNAKFPRK